VDALLAAGMATGIVYNVYVYNRTVYRSIALDRFYNFTFGSMTIGRSVRSLDGRKRRPAVVDRRPLRHIFVNLRTNAWFNLVALKRWTIERLESYRLMCLWRTLEWKRAGCGPLKSTTPIMQMTVIQAAQLNVFDNHSIPLITRNRMVCMVDGLRFVLMKYFPLKVGLCLDCLR